MNFFLNISLGVNIVVYTYDKNRIHLQTHTVSMIIIVWISWISRFIASVEMYEHMNYKLYYRKKILEWVMKFFKYIRVFNLFRLKKLVLRHVNTFKFILKKSINRFSYLSAVSDMTSYVGIRMFSQCNCEYLVVGFFLTNQLNNTCLYGVLFIRYTCIQYMYTVTLMITKYISRF